MSERQLWHIHLQYVRRDQLYAKLWVEHLNTWQVFQHLRSPGGMGRNEEVATLKHRVPPPGPDILDAAYMRDDLSIRANDVVESSARIV